MFSKLKELLLKQEVKNLKREEQLWEVEKKIISRQEKIEQEKDAIKGKGKKKISATKLLILFLFINCTLIELFTGWAIVQSIQIAAIMGIAPDFSPLIALIGAVVSEVMGFAIYAIKSTKENTKDGIVYETTMANLSHDEEADG